jgi:hypothetical protein
MGTQRKNNIAEDEYAWKYKSYKTIGIIDIIHRPVRF